MRAIPKALIAAFALGHLIGTAQAAELTVSAAASLTNAFRDIARNYEAKYGDARVNLNFGASGALLAQMAKGAPVDVFASADQPTMDKAERQGLIDPQTRETFARNSLVVIVPADSQLHLDRLDDLTGQDVKKVAIGNPASVPVGNYSREALDAVNLWDAVSAKAITTQNVRQSLDYVARGEVDAGFVYGTDAGVMKDKVKVSFEVPTQSPISYPIAYTASTSNPAEAKRFINYVLSPEGQSILAKYHFRKP